MKRASLLATVAAFATFALLAAPADAAQTIDVRDAWSRPAIDTGVVYLTIRSHEAFADRLIDGASPVARHVEFHQTTASHDMHEMAMDPNMSGMSGMSGMSAMTTEMHRLRMIPIPAGGKLTFAPGGYHVMLIGLRHTLMAGQSFPLRLRFARAGWIVVKSQVRGA
jgi:copper(I)-binding protein